MHLYICIYVYKSVHINIYIYNNKNYLAILFKISLT